MLARCYGRNLSCVLPLLAGCLPAEAPPARDAIVRCTFAYFEAYEADELLETLERVVAEREEGVDEDSEGDDEGKGPVKGLGDERAR